MRTCAIVLTWVLALGTLSAAVTTAVQPDGRYTIIFTDQGWTFSGSVRQPVFGITRESGNDSLGDYHEVLFRYGSREAAIRAYSSSVLFSLRYLSAAAGSDAFPAFDTYPATPHRFGYSELWEYGFTRWDMGPDGPWAFFDSRGSTFLISPASNFMLAETRWSDSGAAIECAIDRRIPTLPAGFTHRTVLVAARGINAAFERWGQALTTGLARPGPDADTVLLQLGYWTDWGATYYYNPGQAELYRERLLAIRDDFRSRGIPLGYLQLDSWHYPKGPRASWQDGESGMYVFEPDRALFPDGLNTFRKQLGAPLVAHARWIDPVSPYRRKFRMSRNVAVDEGYWKEIAVRLKADGVEVYEQDWLSAIGKAIPEQNLTDPDAFMDNMAGAMRAQGLTMQYCMPQPRHFLQGARYPNLTTIRVSPDRFCRDRWDRFLYNSRLAAALGIWPWADVFMSGETDNLLLATLSAGPVGVGDPVGALDGDNLLRAARADGVIVKPDVPIVPLDDTFVADAQGAHGPMVAATRTDHEAGRALYVFAYTRGEDGSAVFTPAALGLSGRVYVRNWHTGRGRLQDASEPFREPLTDGRAYYVVVPAGPSGIAFLGDSGQFVSLGKQRIARVSDDGTLEVTVLFAATENARLIEGYSPALPLAVPTRGSVEYPDYDPATGIFRLWVTHSGDGAAVIRLHPSR